MRPKVSVCLITYNHQAFVRQALDGIMMQQCTFDFEVVAGDDHSTDDTVAIIKEYAQKYPGKIKLNDYPVNVGMTENWKRCILACGGEYVALLEGDDYWTDPLKLQKQVDILNKNTDLSYCCHDVETIFEAGVPKVDTIYHIGQTSSFTIYDMLNKRGFIPTCSVVFRQNMLPSFPAWVDKNIKCIDLTVELILATRGPFYYINERMGIYRLHVGGISHVSWVRKINKLEYDTIHILRLLDKHTRHRYKSEIANRIEELYHRLLHMNPPKSIAYARALMGLLSVKPRNNMNLFKGWIINNFIPDVLYKFYRNTF